jgi:hypothetical protein
VSIRVALASFRNGNYAGVRRYGQNAHPVKMSGIEIFWGNILNEIPKFVDNPCVRTGFILFDYLTNQINELVKNKYGT